jgi:histidine ammonia-lyase
LSITRIGAARLAVADVVDIARHGTKVEIDEAARLRVADARAVVLRLAEGDAAIYGVNSALGANTGQRLAPADLSDYQLRAVRARAVAVGDRYDRASVRAMMTARIAGMAAGGSGVSLEVLDALVAMLNAQVHPVVPRYGSIGVADLPQLSHVALPLVGEGEAEYEGNVRSGSEALGRAGLTPSTLGPKDGLALISSNAATIGRAALIVDEALALASAWRSAIALSFEAFRANVSVLDARVVAARPAAGQVEVAEQLRALLVGSALFERGSARRVQDPLSFRVVAQVHGSLASALAQAREQVEIELNSAAESPLVMTSDGTMLSNGNFHLPALALAFDTSAIAFAQATSLGVERVIRFMTPAFTDLPLQLTRHGPAHSGFATLQKTLTALWSEIRLRANPGSLDFLPVSEGVEDHATMALGTVEKLSDLLARVRYVIAIELVVAAQAIDVRGLDVNRLGKGAKRAYATVRERVSALDVDRPIGPDVDDIGELVAERRFDFESRS